MGTADGEVGLAGRGAHLGLTAEVDEFTSEFALVLGYGGVHAAWEEGMVPGSDFAILMDKQQ